MMLMGLLTASFIYVVQCEVCHMCNTTASHVDCENTTDCQTNDGCYSKTTVTDGVRYYSKGCFNHALILCPSVHLPYCSSEFATFCCLGDRCNEPNPVTIWRPVTPTNLRVTELTTSSLTLSWAILCQHEYKFEINYNKVGEKKTTVKDIENNMFGISDLAPGWYQFSIRSHYNGRSSDTSTIHRNVPNSKQTIHTYCAVTNNSTINNTNSTIWQTCQLNQQRCFTILRYYTDGGQAFVTRGCIAYEACEAVLGKYDHHCVPGLAQAFCNFCCKGNACNQDHDVILENFTCDKIPMKDRIDCGWEDINESTCESRSCCYQTTNSLKYDKWCYHKRYAAVQQAPTTVPTTTASSSNDAYVGGIVYWMFIIILLAILVFLLISFLFAYWFFEKKKNKNSNFNGMDAFNNN